MCRVIQQQQEAAQVCPHMAKQNRRQKDSDEGALPSKPLFNPLSHRLNV